MSKQPGFPVLSAKVALYIWLHKVSRDLSYLHFRLQFDLNFLLLNVSWVYMPLVIYFATVLATGEFYIELTVHNFFKANILKSLFKSTTYYYPPDLLTYSNILY